VPMIIIKLLGNLKLSGTAVQHFFGEGKKVMTSGGLLEIGKVTMQIKGGAAMRDTAQICCSSRSIPHCYLSEVASESISR